jgi:TatD DNase family protein
MELVDTHCHIQSAGLSEGEKTTRELWAKAPELTGDQLVANAVDASVTRLICVGCELEDSKLAISFAGKHENCWATIGLHPHEAQHFAGKPTLLKEFSGLASRPKVVAVGECGFDFYYNHSPKAAQIEVLKFQIELALEHDLPLVFHVRDAFDDFWPLFDSYQGIRGVLHSFTDNMENLKKATERNLYIGVNGIATFAKNPAQLDVYRAIPLQNLLLETDAPFLTPTPYRGSINEPKQVRTVADFVADLRGESRENMSAVTTSNAQTLFGI